MSKNWSGSTRRIDSWMASLHWSDEPMFLVIGNMAIVELDGLIRIRLISGLRLKATATQAALRQRRLRARRKRGKHHLPAKAVHRP